MHACSLATLGLAYKPSAQAMVRGRPASWGLGPKPAIFPPVWLALERRRLAAEHDKGRVQ